MPADVPLHRLSELLKGMTVYDISVLLGGESVAYPGDMPYGRTVTSFIGQPGTYELSHLVLSAHGGTHIDVPAHFVRNGRRIDDYEPGEFIFPAVVVQTETFPSIVVNDLAGINLQEGDAVLFKTRNSASGLIESAQFREDFVALSEEAARFLAARRIGLVGIDYVSIERPDSKPFPVHRALLENDILILESITLRNVLPGRYTLICLPLKIRDGEASPVRAILIG